MEERKQPDYLQSAGAERQPVIPPEVAKVGVTPTASLTPSKEAQAVGMRAVGAEIPISMEELTLSIGDQGIYRLLKEPITAAGRWLGEMLNRFRKKEKLERAYAN